MLCIRIYLLFRPQTQCNAYVDSVSIQLVRCRSVDHPHVSATPAPKPYTAPCWIATTAVHTCSQSSGKCLPGKQQCNNTPASNWPAHGRLEQETVSDCLSKTCWVCDSFFSCWFLWEQEKKRQNYCLKNNEACHPIKTFQKTEQCNFSPVGTHWAIRDDDVLM